MELMRNGFWNCFDGANTKDGCDVKVGFDVAVNITGAKHKLFFSCCQIK